MLGSRANDVGKASEISGILTQSQLPTNLLIREETGDYLAPGLINL